MQVENTAGIWTMVVSAGPLVQLVLLILTTFSLLCWTVILTKARRFRQADLGNGDFEEVFWESEILSQVQSHAGRIPESPMAGVFLTGYQELVRLQKSSQTRSVTPNTRVWLDILERSLQKGIREELAALERTLSVLATTGNAAPFIGLFGTVWGIMRSFHDIGLTGSASLATVAPGISEALVATAAGLAAAIPAVIAFNSFMSRLSRMETALQGFAADFLNTVERQLVQGKVASDAPEREDA
jgi:biopolymer transport protein TolQ